MKLAMGAGRGGGVCGISTAGTAARVAAFSSGALAVARASTFAGAAGFFARVSAAGVRRPLVAFGFDATPRRPRVSLSRARAALRAGLPVDL